MSLTTAHLGRPPAPAKLKILQVANALFYTEGIHTVGVDRIIAAARVTKATFYKHYRSKDLLIVAYVKRQHERARELHESAMATSSDPSTQLRALATAIEKVTKDPRFHGCPFINAAAQFSDPMHPVRHEVMRHRIWERERLLDLVEALGHPEPLHGVDDMMLFRDGALSGSNLGEPEAAVAALRRAAERIIDEASERRAVA